FTPHPAPTIPRLPRQYRGELPDEDRLLYPTPRQNECWLDLEHRDAERQFVANDAALFTLAPIIFCSDIDPPVRLFAAALADYEDEGVPLTGNFGFAGELACASLQANVPYTFVHGADIQLRRVIDTDLWCRD